MNRLARYLVAFAAIVLSQGLAAGTANAALVTVDFSGQIDNGDLVGDTFSGFVTYDDSLLTGIGDEFIELTDFEINFNGPVLMDTFGAVDAFGLNGFDFGVQFFDGDFLGVGMVVDTSDPIFELAPGFFDISEAAFFYDPPSQGTSGGTGSITYTFQAISVPEPATIGLLLVSCLCFARRPERTGQFFGS